MPKTAGPRPSDRIVLAIAEVVAAQFGVDATAIHRGATVRRGTYHVGLARHVALYVIGVSLGYGSVVAAEALGFDRTVAHYAARRVEDMRDDPKFEAMLSRIEREFDSARSMA